MDASLLTPHYLFLAVLVGFFAIRFVLSDWNSYWLDEIYSIGFYGLDNASSLQVIRQNATDIHPPLYNLILFTWMSLIGDSEVATRSLSNLYTAGATVCLYILVLKLWDRRLALAACIVFSLMYIPFWYGMETRSYAQTLFLSSLSSLLLFYYLRSLPSGENWRRLFYNKHLLFLTAANFALLMTHYYNAFFIAAQATFMLFYFLHRNRGSSRLSGLAKVIVVAAIPVVLFIAAWGPVMVKNYQSYAHLGDAPSMTPWSIFVDLVFSPNLGDSPLTLMVLSLLVLAVVLRAAFKLLKEDISVGADRKYFVFYFLFCAILPCIAAYILVFVTDSEKLHSRYIIFCTPPLAVLLVLAFEELVGIVDRATGVLSGFRFHRQYRRLASAFALAVAVLLVLPGGHAAATKSKNDWRGIASQVVDLIDGDPQHRYVVYETTFRDYPTLDYYFARLSHDICVNDVIRRRDEASDKPFRFETKLAELSRYDYLVVVFTHHKKRHFPQAVNRLSELFHLHFRLMNKDGEGFLVFKIPPGRHGPATLGAIEGAKCHPQRPARLNERST